MAFTLPSGEQARYTGQTDSRGFPILTDNAGNLYTNQNGKFILSSPAGGTSSTTGNSSMFSYLDEGITGFTLPGALYDPQLSGDFQGQSEEEVGAYYDKDMEMLDKSIKIAKTQAEAVKKLAEEQQEKTEKRTYANEDRKFADLLDSAQMGFAGKGTYTSGFRKGAAEDQATERAANLEETQQSFSDTAANRNLGYSQFLENTAFKEETGKLDIDRARNEAIIQRQEQLRGQEEAKRRSATDVANQAFGQFLTSGGVA